MPGGAENSVRLEVSLISHDFSPQIARWKEALIGLGLRVCYKLLQLLFLGNSPHIFCEPMPLFLAMRPLVYRASQDLGDEHLANMLWRPSRCEQPLNLAYVMSQCNSASRCFKFLFCKKIPSFPYQFVSSLENLRDACQPGWPPSMMLGAECRLQATKVNFSLCQLA